jgi:hypothetical protein
MQHRFVSLSLFGIAIGLAACSDTQDGPLRTSRAEVVASDGPIARITELPTHGDAFVPRTGHAVASVDNQVFVVRGVTDDVETQTNTFTHDVVRLNPFGAVLHVAAERGAETPGEMSFHCMAGDDRTNGSLYLFGGAHFVFQLDPDFFRSLRVFDQLWRYDVSSKRWSALAPSGVRPAARAGCVADFVGGSMYVFGGLNRFLALNAELWRFDADAGAWTHLEPVGPAPSPRFIPSSAVDAEAGKIYYYAGHVLGPAGFTNVNDFWVYDVATNRFRQLPVGPTPPRDEGALSVLKTPSGKKYVVFAAGHSASSVHCAGFPEDVTATNEVWAFDVEAETWHQLETEGPAPRLQHHRGATLKNHLYMAGGWHDEPDTERVCRKVWNDRFFDLTLIDR